jgi:hypothetical protein
MKLTATLIAMAAASAMAATDSQDFYATRAQQVFKQENARNLEHGYEKGDDVPYFTWDGFVSDKPLYFEVHGGKIRLIQGKKKFNFSLVSAISLPGADRDSRALDEKGPSLFIKSTKNPKHSLICVESLGPDIYIPPRPYREVYLITNPLGSPRLYRLSGINASCRGIEQAPGGNLLVPVWDIERSRTPNVIINYFSLEPSKFKKTRISVTGSIVDGNTQDYEIN